MPGRPQDLLGIFLVLSGALVGIAAAIMGVGGGFLTFPIFVYVLGVSSIDHGRHRHLPDRVHRRLRRHRPVRDLRLHLLHAGHGHAARLAARHPDRHPGDQGRIRASPSAGSSPWR
ncbi:MAG: sulfite exporter TauE/SafE family protein [Chromatiales bacterium]|nr:sulfite exporter TauE/SafE family protein [Chromatiales bacterium]